MYYGYKIEKGKSVVSFCHESYDGAPDTPDGSSSDHRFGTAYDLQDAVEQIQEQVEFYELDTDGNFTG